MIGERPVIVVRDRDGSVNVLENRCARRARSFARRIRQREVFVCPYHQWGYRLNGELAGVPMKGGVGGRGGMDAEFKLEEHGLNRLKVQVHNGIVFASFDAGRRTVRQFIGSGLMPFFNRTFDGRKLTCLGTAGSAFAATGS